jgi:hypothetical protein
MSSELLKEFDRNLLLAEQNSAAAAHLARELARDVSLMASQLDAATRRADAAAVANKAAPASEAVLPYWVGDRTERIMMLEGSLASRVVRSKERLASLADAEFRVYSQWGEDGIIDWLLEHVPVSNTRFIEFGVSAFEEANCRFLLKHRNWRGLVLDESEHYMNILRARAEYWMYDISGVQAFVTAENINQIITDNSFYGAAGILSIDVDGNDYWIWDAIDCVDPAIVICEYNPILGDTRPIVVPYDAEFERFKGHHSGLYFGSSIAALIVLGKKKGFTFVGSCSNGINAFFVRDDLADRVLCRLDAVKAFPSRHRDSRDENFTLSFTGGVERFALIKDQPVVDIATGRKLRLGQIKKPYSPEWLAAMT